MSIVGEQGAERIYAHAVDTSPPASPARLPDTLSSLIPTSSLSQLGINIQQNGYFAYIAWLFDTATNSIIDGDVEVHVWMSSSEDLGLFGGTAFFFAVADINPQNLHDNLQMLWYDAKAKLGNIVGNSPNRLSTSDFGRTFRISNHIFAPGRGLLFFAGAGSTKKGWQFNVYFDRPDRPSGASIPTSLLASATTTSTTQQYTTSESFPTTAASTCSISVSLTANSTGGPAPLTVTFYASVTGAKGAVQYDWWFGDGSGKDYHNLCHEEHLSRWKNLKVVRKDIRPLCKGRNLLCRTVDVS